MRTERGKEGGKEGEVAVRIGVRQTPLAVSEACVGAMSGSKDRCVLGNRNLGDLRKVGKSSCNVQVNGTR